MKTKIYEPFPRAFLHVDGDSFFVACELASRPDLKGLPVVTGLEKGIVSAMSQEAKKRGITRAMKLSDARKLCPGLVTISSNFQAYETYSQRMIAILKRYTKKVEAYSIDECFVDITELADVLHMNYTEIAERMKRDLESELGITFSVGVSITKTLAKIASGFKKPSGLTVVPGNEIDIFLNQVAIEDVWGIGRRTAIILRKWGIATAFQFIVKEDSWVRSFFSKPCQEIHQELQGIKIFSLHDGSRREYQSTSRTRTFSKPSQDEAYVFAELVRNVEQVCKTLRSRGTFGKKISIFLKTQQFTYEMVDFELPYAAATPREMMQFIRLRFSALFQKGVMYRATGITVSQLSSCRETSLNLFNESEKSTTTDTIYESLDKLQNKYGTPLVWIGSSIPRGSNTIKTMGTVKRFAKKFSIPSLGFVS
jgi:DNA polymerase-4/DNA polymerase V